MCTKWYTEEGSVRGHRGPVLPEYLQGFVKATQHHGDELNPLEATFIHHIKDTKCQESQVIYPLNVQEKSKNPSSNQTNPPHPHTQTHTHIHTNFQTRELLQSEGFYMLTQAWGRGAEKE